MWVSCIGLSKLSMEVWAEDRTVSDLTYPRVVRNGMKSELIDGSQTCHGNGPRNLHQTPFSQALKLFHASHVGQRDGEIRSLRFKMYSVRDALC